MSKIMINGQELSISDFVNVARKGYKVELTAEAVECVNTARKMVDELVDNKKKVYGITTGFGKFSDVTISKDETKHLQRNLIISHACGIGNPFPNDVVKGIMLLRINNLAKGHSGIRLSTLKTLIEMINKDVYPVIPEKGSLGASGDLTPLSHMVLVMLGQGEASYKGQRMTGQEAMDKAGIAVIELTSKEGLALINGTQVMTAVAALTIYDAERLMKLSDIAASLTVEALNGITDAFDLRIQRTRPHQGQIDTAENILKILQGSGLTTKQGEIRVQDAYSLRCIPQVHGASKDALKFCINKVNIEMNSVTDNPIIFPEEDLVLSGGNFHGQPMALPLDFLGIALAELANISERRIERLVNPQLSGMPGFLTEKGGLHSGFMITQYVAAALVSENKVLAHPASVDSIPSSANQEDHVSMGTIGARKAAEILDNVQNVVAIEILSACQAIEFKDPALLGKGSKIAYSIVRKNVARLVDDRVMYKDINAVYELVTNNSILDAVEEQIGILK